MREVVHPASSQWEEAFLTMLPPLLDGGPHQTSSCPQRQEHEDSPDDIGAGRQALEEASIRTERSMGVECDAEDGHQYLRPESAGHRKHRPPAPVRRMPEAPRDDKEANRHRIHNHDQAGGMERVLDEDPDTNQSQTLNAMYDGIRSRAHATFEDPAPHKSEPNDAEAAEHKIGALDPASGTKTEGANGLLPGIVAGPGRAFDQVDDQEEYRATYPDGQPHEHWPRNRDSRGTKCRRNGLGRRLRRRGWHGHGRLAFCDWCYTGCGRAEGRQGATASIIPVR